MTEVKVQMFAGLQKTVVLDARFSIFLPDTDKHKVQLSAVKHAEVKEYVLDKLCEFFNGATAMPPTDARWIGADETVTKEKTTVIYSFCTLEELIGKGDDLVALMMYVGTELNQESVAVEIGSKLYITDI